MDQEVKDKGVIAVLLKRFESEIYPKAQLLKTKVDNGAILDEQDLSFLEQTLADTHQIMAIVSRHPEYATLVKAALLMYEEIMSKSQQNSQNS